jgi:hypothetical protein
VALGWGGGALFTGCTVREAQRWRYERDDSETCTVAGVWPARPMEYRTPGRCSPLTMGARQRKVEDKRSGEPLAPAGTDPPGKGALMAPKQDTASPSRLQNAEAGLNAAMTEVATQLDDPRLVAGDRMRLLQRQAELGDLRDEMALRARRSGRY